MIEFKRPAPGDFAPFYQKYVDLVEEGDILKILKLTAFETIVLFESINEEVWNYSYAPGKWSAKESVLHMIDVERVMSYRALRIARDDSTELPGFDHDQYVPVSGAGMRSGASIIEEYQAVRNATIQLLKYLPAEAWDRKGLASKNPVSVRALAYIIAGHELHHCKILKNKYLTNESINQS